MVRTCSHAGFMNFVTVNEHQAAFFDMISVLADKIKTFAFHEVINLGFIMKMFGGHGVFVVTDDSVDGDAVESFFKKGLTHKVPFLCGKYKSKNI